MSIEKEVKDQLANLGIKTSDKNQIESLGLELTVCQFIVVVLSIFAIVFLFAPLLFLKDITFMLVFFALSLLSLSFGVWFWVKKAEVCEHPENYD
jgi:hypothetical protein